MLGLTLKSILKRHDLPHNHNYGDRALKKVSSCGEGSREVWIRESRARLREPSNHHTRRSARTISSSGKSGQRKLLYRCFQVFSILIVGISLYALVENIKYLIENHAGDVDELSQGTDGRLLNINEELQSWVIQERYDATPSTPPPKGRGEEEFKTIEKLHASKLQVSKKFVLNATALSFIINNASICKTHKSSGKLGSGIYFMIIVHSAPEHFAARQAIRSTWGSIKSLKNKKIRLIFLLGKTGNWVKDSDLVETAIFRESELFGDIVTASFVDSYKNLTYKHLMGYKWATSFCPDSTFILKSDDDAFIDIFQLFDFITRTYGYKPSPGTLICNVFPEGSKPVRASDKMGTKWAVSKEEYPHDIYPKYCGGLAYLVTPDVVKQILSVSDKVKLFWIDDVWVTGILRAIIGIEPFYMNLRYSYEPERYRKWLNFPLNKATNETSHLISAQKMIPKFPFMVTHIERGSNFSEEMSQLWRKTLRAWSEEHGNVVAYQ